MLGNGPHVLGKSTFGIMSHSGLLYVAFRIVSHLGFYPSGLCSIREYVVWDYVAFEVMLFGIMSHPGLCCIRTYVVRDYVLLVNVNVLRRNVVWHNVGVSFYICVWIYSNIQRC